jgi:uncharacterized protein (DUF362 family)
MKVSIVKCEDYKQSDVDKAVKDSIDLLGGIDKFISKGDKVLLKINQLQAKRPEDCVTTHPSVIESVIKLVRSADELIYTT